MKRLPTILLMALATLAAMLNTGCTTTGSSARSEGDRSGVTVFGDIDTGVSRVR